jgi:hypothetical protein
MKHNYRLFIYLILLVFLLSVPIYWISRLGKLEQLSIAEQRKLKTFPTWEDYKKGAKQLFQRNVPSVSSLIQNKFENAANDQFPFRYELTQAERVVERGLISLAYFLLNDPAIPASMTIPVSNTMPYFVMRDGSRMFNPPSFYNEGIKKRIDQRINNYCELVKLYPKQNFYIFYLERIQVSKYYPLNSYFPDADNGRSFKYFEKNLPPKIGLSKLMLTGYQDYVEKFFRTDHHWKIQAAWKGYEEIYKMLAPGHPNIGPQLTLAGMRVLPGVNYLGSLARQSMFPILPDSFEVADVSLPSYELYITKEREPVKERLEDLAKINNIDPYHNYYDSIYLSSMDIREYYFPNSPARNLLIIGNSYGNSMVVYLASHYRRTYQVYLRYYKDFSLARFIKKHKIDDVLILGDDTVVYSRKSWAIKP